MSRAKTVPARTAEPVEDIDDEPEPRSDVLPEEFDEDGDDSELAEETGLDLSDASDLDADNVPADEEFDRVMQAPD